jgi:hypothetical protein
MHVILSDFISYGVVGVSLRWLLESALSFLSDGLLQHGSSIIKVIQIEKAMRKEAVQKTQSYVIREATSHPLPRLSDSAHT